MTTDASSSPRRVLLLATSLSRGGAQRQVTDLAVAYRDRGLAVAAVSLIPLTDEYLGELRAAGVEVVSLGMRRGRPSIGALRAYRALLRSWRPDVVHSHMVHANLLARVGHPFARHVPVVCTVHSLIEGGRWREIAYRVTDPLASVTTAVSTMSAERYVRVGAVPKGRMLVTQNGFAMRRAHAPAGAREAIRAELGVENGFLFLAVGRLVEVKRYDRLIAAFAEVHRQRPHARLAIAGDGPEEVALKAAAASAGVGDTARLLGDRRDVSSLLAAADGFVLTSDWEGLPMVLLEAAAQAVPIVSTDVGGCSEVARPGSGAILTGTDPAQVAAGMLALIDRPAEERAAIGARLRTHVMETFDLDAVVDRWLRIYAGAMAGR